MRSLFYTNNAFILCSPLVSSSSYTSWATQTWAAYLGTPHHILATLADRPIFTSPSCGRIGDKRCIAMKHYIECPVHPGNFHSTKAACVKCESARRRSQKGDAEPDKENQHPSESGANDNSKNDTKAKKKAKGCRSKPTHEKTIKQLRREKQAARKAQASCGDDKQKQGK